MGLLGWLGTLVIPLLIFTSEPPPSNYCDTNTKNVDHRQWKNPGVPENTKNLKKKPGVSEKNIRYNWHQNVNYRKSTKTFVSQKSALFFVLLAAAGLARLGGISDYSSSPQSTPLLAFAFSPLPFLSSYHNHKMWCKKTQNWPCYNFFYFCDGLVGGRWVGWLDLLKSGNWGLSPLSIQRSI